MFTYSHANTPLSQSKRAYYLSYFINLNSAREIKFHRCLFMLSIKLEIRIFTSKSPKNAEEMFYKVWFTCKVIVLPIRPRFLFCFVCLFFWKFSLSPRRWIFKFLMFPSNTGSDVIWRLDVGVKWTILGDPGAVSRMGEKARRKFSSTGGKARGYRLSPDHFQRVKRKQAPDLAPKMLCIIVPNRRTASPEFFSWVRTQRLLTRSRLFWLMHQIVQSI